MTANTRAILAAAVEYVATLLNTEIEGHACAIDENDERHDGVLRLSQVQVLADRHFSRFKTCALREAASQEIDDDARIVCSWTPDWRLRLDLVGVAS